MTDTEQDRMRDGAIVAQVRAGDRDAYRLLVERHSRGLFRLAYRMTGNEQDAEDVVQEALLRAFRQLHQYDGSAAFGTWVHRIAVNYSLDLLRSRKRHQAQEQVDSEPFLASAAAAASDPLPDRRMFSTQVRERLRSAMARLSEQERAAFLLRHYEGQSIDEIGSALGLNASAAKHSVFRAVRKLREALEPVVGGVR